MVLVMRIPQNGLFIVRNCLLMVLRKRKPSTWKSCSRQLIPLPIPCTYKRCTGRRGAQASARVVCLRVCAPGTKIGGCRELVVHGQSRVLVGSMMVMVKGSTSLLRNHLELLLLLSH